MKRQGFTLIEILTAMAVFLTLTGLITVNFIRPQTKASVDSIVSVLVSDLKQQQLKAMLGEGGVSGATAFGIYFASGQYTLFSGEVYMEANAGNFPVLTDGTTVISTNFPDRQIVFARQSGEIVNFSESANRITVQSPGGGETKNITLNRFGVVTIN